MHIVSHVRRSVTIRLDGAEQFQHTAQVRYRGKEFTARINIISVGGNSDKSLEEMGFLLEGTGINRDGSAGPIRRYEYNLKKVLAILPAHIVQAIVEEFNAQLLPAIYHPGQVRVLP